jgi:hypothetical protein
VHEPGGTPAVRMGAQRRTKAQIQLAKEGVLDSEGEGSAWWEFRRRGLERICVSAA